MSKINLQVETTNSGEQEEQREKTDMLRSIGKQSGESVEILSVVILPITTQQYRNYLYDKS